MICADFCRNRARARKALRKPAAFACCVSSPHFPQPRAPKTDHTGCLSPEAGKGGITDILPSLRSCTSCLRSGQPSLSQPGMRGAPPQGAAVGRTRAPQGRLCLTPPREPPPGSLPPAPRRLGARRVAAPTEVVRREGVPGAPRSGRGDGGGGPSPIAALRPWDPVHCSWCCLRSCCVCLRRQPLICRFPSCPALLTDRAPESHGSWGDRLCAQGSADRPSCLTRAESRGADFTASALFWVLTLSSHLQATRQLQSPPP